MEKWILKKLTSVVTATIISVLFFIPNIQTYAAQRTPAPGRLPLKALYIGTEYMLPTEEQFYFDLRYDFERNGYFAVLCAYDEMNREKAVLKIGYEFEELSIVRSYSESFVIGEIDTYDVRMKERTSDSFFYEPDGRQTRDSDVRLFYEYDAAGRPVLAYNDDSTYMYEYNDLGKLAIIYRKNYNGIMEPETILSYDQNGNLVKSEYCWVEDGITKTEIATEYTYDAYGNIILLRYYDMGNLCGEVEFIY